MKRVLFLEPYYGGSHQFWFEQLQKYSKHAFFPLTLPARHWKWRMHSSASVFSEKMQDLNPEDFDLILCSEFVSINKLRGELHSSWLQIPIFCYFHENQILYPWSQHDKDSHYERNATYILHHLENLRCADRLFFNSLFHLNTLLDELPKVHMEFPKPRPKLELKNIKAKSFVLYPGVEWDDANFQSKNFEISKDQEIPLILWNHRWDDDKNPQSFVWLIQQLIRRKVKFHLALLGDIQKSKAWDYFSTIDKTGSQYIKYLGHQDRTRYQKILAEASIAPVTSHHDFFGISTVEAILAGAKVFVPRRMAYHEHFDLDEFQECSYADDQELLNLVLNYRDVSHPKSRSHCQRYLWSNMIEKYDKLIELS